MTFRLKIIFIIFLFSFFLTEHAISSPTHYSCNGSVINIHSLKFNVIDLNKENCSSIFLDSSNASSFGQIVNSEKNTFQLYKRQFNQLSFSNKVKIWRKITLVSDVDIPLYLSTGLADYINVYLQKTDGSLIILKGGNIVPISQLTNKKFFKDFQIYLEKGKPITIYIELKNKYPYSLVHSLTLFDSESFWQRPYLTKDYFTYFFMGAVLIMIFYNLLLYITSREKNYLLYVLYMVAIIIPSLIDYRFYHKIFPSWSEYPESFLFFTVCVGQTIGLFYISFLRNLNNLSRFTPHFDQYNRIWFRLRIISIPLVVGLFFAEQPVNITHYAQMTDIVFGVANLIATLYVRQTISKYFVWGGGVLVIGATFTVLEFYNVFLFGSRTYGIPIEIGILGELIIFSVGLGIKARLTEMEKRVTERHLLDQLLQNEKLQTKVNRELEQKVKERTAEIEKRNEEILKQNVLLVGQKEELEVQSAVIQKANQAVKEKNEELQVSLKKLKIAQAELVQSEKMASLGILTAGIAHEINNPINFVSANIRPIKNDFGEIKSLFEKYQSLYSSENFSETLRDIKSYEKKIEAKYLFEEIQLLLNGIEEGAVRTREIVLGLKNFSRSDEKNFKPSNIHSGLDSTLMLLESKTKNRIKIVKNYSPDVPYVECLPGKINQVFMNILTNAIQAILNTGTITLTTWMQNGFVKISIKDDGVGIKQIAKEKIFEPFFTTKEIGKGTGLGLSISYGIIEDHHGKIEVSSEEGIGSEFVITLPINQSK